MRQLSDTHPQLSPPVLRRSSRGRKFRTLPVEPPQHSYSCRYPRRGTVLHQLRYRFSIFSPFCPLRSRRRPDFAAARFSPAGNSARPSRPHGGLAPSRKKHVSLEKRAQPVAVRVGVLDGHRFFVSRGLQRFKVVLKLLFYRELLQDVYQAHVQHDRVIAYVTGGCFPVRYCPK